LTNIAKNAVVTFDGIETLEIRSTAVLPVTKKIKDFLKPLKPKVKNPKRKATYQTYIK